MAQRPPSLQAKLPRPTAPQNTLAQATVNYQSTPFTVPQNQQFAPNVTTVTPLRPNQGPPVRIPAQSSGLAPTLSRQSQPIASPASRPIISPSPGPQVASTMVIPLGHVPASNRYPIGPATPKNSRPIATPRQHPPIVPPIQTSSKIHKTTHQRAPVPSKSQPAQPARSSTPPAPPFSPILPAISKDDADKIAGLLRNMDPYNDPRIIGRQPSTKPISESENTDVIALRAALSVLQMQKQTASRDIRLLEEMRDQALKDPEGYVRALLQRVNAPANAHQKDVGLLNETLKFAVEGLWVQGVEGNGTQQLSEAIKSSNEDVDMDAASQGSNSDSSSESDGEQKVKKSKKKERFAAPPKPQNVFRMPPVNWSKYQVVGDALDKLHESQRRRPTLGAPSIDMDTDEQAPEDPYVLAAPYQPFLDQERMSQAAVEGWSPNVGPSGDHPMKTRRAARRQIG